MKKNTFFGHHLSMILPLKISKDYFFNLKKTSSHPPNSSSSLIYFEFLTPLSPESFVFPYHQFKNFPSPKKNTFTFFIRTELHLIFKIKLNLSSTRSKKLPTSKQPAQIEHRL